MVMVYRENKLVFSFLLFCGKTVDNPKTYEYN